MKVRIRFSIIMVFILWVPVWTLAQSRSLDIGVRIQKSIGLYNENGVSIGYSDTTFWKGRIQFGFTYITSRLGSSFHSNAIPQHNFQFSVGVFGRYGKIVRPMIRINSGYFMANYQSEIFNALPNESLLFSTDFGICIETKSPLKITSSLGYQLITGDGITGPGTLFPVFVQTTVSWDIMR